jgi:drug/metabolite transporter (DMT)-like permease
MNKHTGHVPWLAYSCLALSTSLIGTYVGLSKLLVLVFPIFLLAWLRFGIAAVAMLRWIKRQPSEPPLSRRDRWLLFLESFLGNFLFSICMLFGIRASSALAAGVIMAGIPAAVALLSWLFLGERIARRVMAGIACAVLGIAMVASSRDSGAPGTEVSLWGPLLLLAAMLCEASYVVIGKQLTAQVSAKRISALINLWGLILVTPLGLWQALSFDFSAVTGANWSMLIFYALAASVATVWLWMTGLVAVPAASAGVFMVFLPIATALVGILFLGEHMTALQSLAYGLALLGVVLATWPDRLSPAPT